MKKKTLILLYVLLFSFLLIPFSNALVSAAGLGTVKYSYSRTILKDMTYTYTESNNGSPQRAYVLEYNPKTTGIDDKAVFGEEYFGGDQISHNIALAQSKGYTVIAGVNASPFDTSNGVTVGTTIADGRLVVTTSGPLSTNYDNFAICEDGSAYIGHPNFDLKFSVNDGSSISIKYLNRQKKQASNDIYLISSDFATETKTLAASCEAVLNITKGDLVVGTTIEASVESVKENTTRTSFSKGKLVLVGPNKEALGGINVGDKVKISIKDNDSAFDWSKVTQTISGFYQILGKNSNSCKDTKQELLSRSDRNDRHPRTTLGYTKEGKVVIYVADGRQPSVAVGMTDLECSEYMESLGCVAAIRMDGGGSTNLSIRLPGDSKVTTVNNPSDGEERHDADAFLFVLKDDYNKTVNDTLLLHAYPNDLKLLQNTVADIAVKATDENFNPKQTPSYTMSVEGGAGEIVENNRFKAREGSGSGKITITSGNVSTSVNVSVTNQVDELYASVNNLALSPSEKVTLGVKAYYQSDLLICSNEAFTWKCDSEIGTIDKKGNFTATADAGKNGYITVSYGKVSAKVIVTIGQLPIEITGFENDKAGYWKNSQVGGGSGSCEINENLDYVRYGNKSLKINFNLKGTTGTVGTQIWTGNNISIPGTPTAIGMWLYGTESSQGAWVRLQYAQSGSSGALYADFGHIDWIGWKYLEAELDTTVKYPISVKFLVRIMGVTESERLDGVIYVDSLRAVYGFSNDDVTNPTITNMAPLNVTSSSQQTISFDIKDEESGINKDATHFYLDNQEITNLLFKDIQGGFTVSFTPSALIPLTTGEHTVKVRCEDNSGNFKVETWTFTLDTTLPKFSSQSEGEIKVVGDKVKYIISPTTPNFSKLTLNISHKGLDVVSLTSSSCTINKVSETDEMLVLELIPSESSSTITALEIEFSALASGSLSLSINGSYTNAKYSGLSVDVDLVSDTFTASDNAISILDYIVSKIDNFFE